LIISALGLHVRASFFDIEAEIDFKCGVDITSHITALREMAVVQTLISTTYDEVVTLTYYAGALYLDVPSTLVIHL
jgi:hypothetical protein